MAIFQCITSGAEDTFGEEVQVEDSLEVEGQSGPLMSDVLLQLSSLCNANFIVKGGTCPLEGSTRYRSVVSEDLALKVTILCNNDSKMCLYATFILPFYWVHECEYDDRWQKA